MSSASPKRDKNPTNRRTPGDGPPLGIGAGQRSHASFMLWNAAASSLGGRP
jgi:hypothetical protein